ncbi:type II toxin-antitoxin system RelE/ParE family toxin [Jiella sonneratiae]|uniref:Type II toxin-antitoxin system RelE/ParE family toxin n=1 Tax=Jiella sonneratiae TaxID=2816856 RepID=A0ABS3J3M5_9HYPH|nr:type II toxin-antitoxin system RelE/ParE family toxin [Jiella sonneratiae]MBO0903697.1 type II toxin-antitoxin system RelE/ParE family toxin [Jiella sonneratiae]
MRTIVWAPRARTEFRNAMRYLRDRDPHAAQLVSDRIAAGVVALANRPIGRPTKMTGVSVKLILRTSYLVTYRATSDRLEILRLIHQKQKTAPSGDGDS